MNEKVSFKSRINFVDRAVFNKLKNGTQILYKHDVPNIIKDKDFSLKKSELVQAAGL